MYKVLIVDDEEIILESLEEYFEDEGYEVLTAESAEEGFKKCDTIDAAIVDMKLKQHNGNDLIVKMHAKNPNAIYFVHTGSITYKLPSALVRLGLTKKNIFTKPIKDLSIIGERIKELREK